MKEEKLIFKSNIYFRFENKTKITLITLIKERFVKIKSIYTWLKFRLAIIIFLIAKIQKCKEFQAKTSN